jgi:hypothetical protein
MCVAPRNGQKNAHLPVRKAETGRCVWPDFEEITVHRMQYLVAGLFLLPLPARGNANFVVNPTESISAVVGDDTLVWEPPGIGSLNSLGDLVLLGHGGQVLATQTEIVAGDENSSFRCEGVSVNRETKLLDVRYRSGSSLITHSHSFKGGGSDAQGRSVVGRRWRPAPHTRRLEEFECRSAAD